MKAYRKDTGACADYFMFGSFAGVAFDLFANQQALLGVAVALTIAAAAVYHSGEDIRHEVLLLKSVPEKLGTIFVIGEARVTLAFMRLRKRIRTERRVLELRMQKALRLMRQKKLLSRNRLYRTRKIVSA